MSSASRAWAFLTVFSLLFIGVGHLAAGRQGLLWALVLSLAFNALVYFLGDSRLFMQFFGTDLQGQDPWKVRSLTSDIAKKARMQMPHIKIINSKSPQAFALGRSWNHGTLFLTQGLLDRLTTDELQAVVAYLMATIKRQDTFVFSIGSFLIWLTLSVTSFFDTLFRWILGASKKSHSLQSQFFTSLFSPAISFLLRLTVSPNSYFLIDSLAASWIDSPKDLASAIWKLDTYSRTIPFNTTASTSHFFIVSPLTEKNWKRYFISHPNIETRIQRLIGYYPI